MPALVWCGRRWRTGSDDFFTFPVIFAGVRSAWLCLILIAFGKIVGAFDPEGVAAPGAPTDDVACSDPAALEIYFIGIAILNFFFAIEEVALAYHSSRGGILAPMERAMVPKLLTVRVGLWCCELGLSIFGTVAIVEQQSCLDESTARLIIADGIFTSEWVCVAVLVCVALAPYDPLGKTVHERGLEWRETAEYQALWKERMQRGLCCARGSNEAFEDIAKLFADMFRSVDLVPSDIAVGLMLLRRRQKRRQKRNWDSEKYSGCLFPDGSRGIILDAKVVRCKKEPANLPAPGPMPEEDVALLRRVRHYCQWSLGIYGWPMYGLYQPSSWLCRLCSARCCGHRGQADELVDENRCCRCNITALREVLGDASEVVQVVTFSMCNVQEFTPYVLAVDHSQRRLVVALRGTMSVQDVLTDARADVEKLSDYTDDPALQKGWAHKGMLLVAENVRRDIEGRGELDRLRKVYRDYGLVLTGHSLGAGGAALMAVLMHKRYPDLECFAFSPPGALVSTDVARWCIPFITSLVFGKDIVPRLSLPSIAATRNQVMALLAKHTDTPKYRVLNTCGCAGTKVEDGTGEDADLEDMAEDSPRDPYPESPVFGSEPTSPGRRSSFVGSFLGGASFAKRSMLQESRREAARSALKKFARQAVQEKRTATCLPGRVLHFVRDERVDRQRPSRCFGMRQGPPPHVAIWRRYDEIQEIIISQRMVLDHMPYNNLEAICSVLELSVEGAISGFPRSDPLIEWEKRVPKLAEVVNSAIAAASSPARALPNAPCPLAVSRSPSGGGAAVQAASDVVRISCHPTAARAARLSAARARSGSANRGSHSFGTPPAAPAAAPSGAGDGRPSFADIASAYRMGTYNRASIGGRSLSDVPDGRPRSVHWDQGVQPLSSLSVGQLDGPAAPSPRSTAPPQSSSPPLTSPHNVHAQSMQQPAAHPNSAGSPTNFPGRSGTHASSASHGGPVVVTGSTPPERATSGLSDGHPVPTFSSAHGARPSLGSQQGTSPPRRFPSRKLVAMGKI